MKNLWKWLAVVMLLFCVFTVQSAFSETSGTDGNITWGLDDNGVLTISGIGAMKDYADDLLSLPWIDYQDSITGVVVKDGITSIGEYAFSECEYLISVTLPDSITSIGGYAFYNCRYLPQITIPKSVTSIGNRAFFHCTSLTSITIPDGVTSIGESAFWCCYNLTSITIPDSVTSIGEAVFYECSSLSSITVPDSVTFIGDAAFPEQIIIVTTKGSYADTWATEHHLSVVYIDEDNSIDEAFQYIVESDGSISITGYSGHNVDVVIPDFIDGKKVSDIISLTSEDSTMKLRSVTLPQTFSHVWDNNPFSELLYLEAVYVAENNPVYKSTDGVLYTKEDVTLVCYPRKKETDDFLVPSDVRHIAEYAFTGCCGVGNLTAKDGALVSIGAEAFANCLGLRTVTLSCNLDSIGEKAFDSCYSLTCVIIDQSAARINDYAFCDCYCLKHILLPPHSIYGSDDIFSSSPEVTVYTYKKGSTTDYCDEKNISYVIIDRFYETDALDGTWYLESVEGQGDGISLASDLASFYEIIRAFDESIRLSFNGGQGTFRFLEGLLDNDNNDFVYTIEGNILHIGDSKIVFLIRELPENGVTELVLSEGSLTLTLSKEQSFAINANRADGIKNDSDLRALLENDKSLDPYALTDSVPAGISTWIPVEALLNDVHYSLEEVGIDPESQAFVYNSFSENSGMLKVSSTGEVFECVQYDHFVCLCYHDTPIQLFYCVEDKLYLVSGYHLLVYDRAETSAADLSFDWFENSKNLDSSEEALEIQTTAPSPTDPPVPTPEPVTWMLDDNGVLTISGNAPMENYTHSSSPDWREKKDTIVNVIIEAGVTSIGDYAFYQCTNLSSVTIPDSVTAIGNHAFYNCYNLSSVTIPDSVTTIGDYAFYGCSRLTDITIPDGITAIGRCVFNGCYLLTEITIPDSVKSIGSFAFANCLSLTGITIPDSVINIGEQAFEGCSGLISATIPNSVTDIGDYAFHDCVRLTSITIPASVTTIHTGTFLGCGSLTDVTIENGITSIDYRAFDGCVRLSSVTIPDSVTSIHNSFPAHVNIITSKGSYADAWANENAFTVTYNDSNHDTNTVSVEQNPAPANDSATPTPAPVTAAPATQAPQPAASLKSITIKGTAPNSSFAGYSDEDPSFSVTLYADGTAELYERYMEETSRYQIAWSWDGDTLRTADSVGSILYTRFSNGVGTYYFYNSPVEVTLPANAADFFMEALGYVPDGVLNGGTTPETPVEIVVEAPPAGDETQLPGAPQDGRDWSSLYYDFIMNKGFLRSGKTFYDRNSEESFTGPTFCLYDLDLDGTPELIAFNGTYVHANAETYLFTVMDGNVVCLGSVGGDISQIEYLDDGRYPGLLTEMGGMGSYWVFYYTLDHTGTLNREEIMTVEQAGGFSFTQKTGDDALFELVMAGMERNTGLRREDNHFLRNYTPEEIQDMGWEDFIAAQKSFRPASSLSEVTTSNMTDLIEAPTPDSTNITSSPSITLPISWMLDDKGVLTISGTGTMENYNISDPPEWKNYKDFIISVIIEDGVTSIGNYAFQGCASLTNVTIPNSVTSIGEGAFGECAELTNVIIPDSVTRIGDFAFVACTNLSGITIPANVLSIGDWAFSTCVSLTSVIIEDGVTSIGNHAFVYTNLTSVTIPASITFIGDNAFPDNVILDIYKDSYADTWAIEQDLKLVDASADNSYSQLEALIARCYQYGLGREGSSPEIAYWVDLVNNGEKAPAEIVQDIFSSAEFQNRQLGNEELVSILYWVYFNREADAAGLAGWTEMLNIGASLKTVEEGFANSDEFRNIFALTPMPVTPAPVTPVPITPIPVTPVPVTPIPVTPVPVTPVPVTTAPAVPTLWPSTSMPKITIHGTAPNSSFAGYSDEDPSFSVTLYADGTAELYERYMEETSRYQIAWSWNGDTLRTIDSVGSILYTRFSNGVGTYYFYNSPVEVTLPANAADFFIQAIGYVPDGVQNGDVTSGTPAGDETQLPGAPQDGRDWSSLYYDFIMNEGFLRSGRTFYDRNSEESFTGPTFCLYDLDLDGTPELIAFNGTYVHANAETYLFTVMDGNVVCLGSVGGDISQIEYLDDGRYPGLLTEMGGMGSYWVFYYTLDHTGTLNREEIMTVEQAGGFSFTQKTGDDALFELVMAGMERNTGLRREDNHFLRSYTPEEIQDMGWDNFTSVQQISSPVTHPVEYDKTALEALIARCYQYGLGREGSSPEIAYWVDLMKNGEKTPAEIIQSILGSAEFQNRQLGNEELVSVLYQVYFNREADEEGLAAWIGMLNNGVSRETIEEGFGNSYEFNKIIEAMKK